MISLNFDLAFTCKCNPKSNLALHLLVDAPSNLLYLTVILDMNYLKLTVKNLKIGPKYP